MAGRGPLQVDDRADAARDEVADDVEAGAGCGQGHGFEARRDLLGAAGVEGRHEAVMAGVGRLEHVEDLWAADLTDDDAIGTHPEGVADQLAERHLAAPFDVGWARLEPDDVGTGELQLRHVLDGHDAFLGRDGGGEDVEQGRLAGPGGPGHGDGDPGGDHGLQQPGRGGVEGVTLDQVVEVEPASGERPDGDHRAVRGQRGKDRVEPLAAGEAGVDPGSGLVDPEPEGGDHALDQRGHCGGGREAHGGPFDGAAALDPHLGGTVDQDVGDRRVREERSQRAEPRQLVADRADERRQVGP
jgi:hypothetical protein